MRPGATCSSTDQMETAQRGADRSSALFQRLLAGWVKRIRGVMQAAGHLLCRRIAINKLDLSRFDAAPLIAFTATKETNYEHGKNG